MNDRRLTLARVTHLDLPAVSSRCICTLSACARSASASCTSAPRSTSGSALRGAAEDLGFSTLVVSDHFGKQLAPLPALMSAAAVTSRIRLGTIVLDNDFRHPAALAKEAATIDVLTGGRLELGVGAGWLEADYTKTGIAYDPPGVRLARLGEAVHILKGFFSSADTLTFAASITAFTDLECFPRPVQQPRPPLMIGGRQRACCR